MTLERSRGEKTAMFRALSNLERKMDRAEEVRGVLAPALNFGRIFPVSTFAVGEASQFNVAASEGVCYVVVGEEATVEAGEHLGRGDGALRTSWHEAPATAALGDQGVGGLAPRRCTHQVQGLRGSQTVLRHQLTHVRRLLEIDGGKVAGCRRA
eukprot:scaffold113701_cov66-Phaeocystis_antarctica.AAC.3